MRPVRLPADAPKAHKYRAQPKQVEGIRFASKREAARYWELRLLEKAGVIRDLELQPRFPLVVAGVQLGVYVGDFRYRERADLTRHGDRAAEFVVVEDVKGFKTALYKWKARHMLAQYGIEIREI